MAFKMPSKNDARERLYTVLHSVNTLEKPYQTFAKKVRDPTKQLEGVIRYSEPNTTGFRYEESKGYNYGPNGDVYFEVDTTQGYIGDMFIEVNLPRYQSGDGITEIQYKPLPALNVFSEIQVTLGNETQSRYIFKPKQLFNIIQYVNDYHSKEFIMTQDLGGYAPVGQSYVTNPGAVRIPLPLFGSSVEHLNITNDIQPFPLHLVKNKMRVKLQLAPEGGLSVQSGSSTVTPTLMRFYHREHLVQNTINAATVLRNPNGSRAPIKIPERYFVNQNIPNISIKNGDVTVIPLRNLLKNGEMTNLLLHFTKNSDDQAGLHFNFEEMNRFEFVIGDRTVFNTDSLKLFKWEVTSNSKQNNYCIGSVLKGNSKDDYSAQNFQMHIPLTSHAKDYRNYLSNGVCPENNDMTLYVYGLEAFTANLSVTAIYRSLFHIDSAGETSVQTREGA